MFGFLKDKIKNALSSFTKKFDEEAEVVETKTEKKLPERLEETVGQKEAAKEEKKIEVKEKKKKEKDHTHILKENKTEAKKEDEDKKTVEAPEEKKGFFAKVAQAVTTKKISESQFDELFWDLEVELLESNVAFEVIEKIKGDLKGKLVDAPLKRGEVEKAIEESLRESINEVLDFPEFDMLARAKEKKPYVIVFIGVNGSGKTTTIAKIAHYLKKHKLSSVLVAADTFRAASIHQLEEQGNRVGVKVIKHDYGSDPAAVAFDGVKYAQQKNIDVVLIDTAGRQHSNTNLMEEMKKIVRVVKPDLKVYIGEMIAGNDCIEQIKDFDTVINIDGVVLSKADIDEKGGTALSVSYVTKKPIFYIGVGQELDDLKVFKREDMIKTLLS